MPVIVLFKNPSALGCKTGRDLGDGLEEETAGDTGTGSSCSRAGSLTGREGTHPGVMRADLLVGSPGGSLAFLGAMIAGC